MELTEGGAKTKTQVSRLLKEEGSSGGKTVG